MIDAETEGIMLGYLGKINDYFANRHYIPVRHYIGGKGVPELVLEHKQLRLSKIDEMRNDSQEGEHVIHIFMECLFELLEEKLITSDEYELLKKCTKNLNNHVISSIIDGRFESGRVNTTPYVVCFTDR